MKKVAIVGYGNIAKYAIDAINASKDMELAGIVRRKASLIPEYPNIKVVDDIEKLGDVHVAILTLPSRHIKENAKKYLKLGINTVDSFDIHDLICDIKRELDEFAKKYNAVSIVSAGWDPGSDSIIRALLLACAPKGETYTNFGPGLSMGHSVAVKSIPGVKDAISITIPNGTSIHRRLVYIETDGSLEFESVCEKIKEDSYFKNDETHIIEVDNIDDYRDVGHGVNIQRRGVSGITNNQKFEFNMSINNPALTSQLLCSAARATFNQPAGAYTLIEVPVIDLLEGSRDDIIKRIV